VVKTTLKASPFFLIAAFPSNPLWPMSTRSKALVASEGYHVVIALNIRTTGMAWRLQGTYEKHTYTGAGHAAASGSSREVLSVEILPWSQHTCSRSCSKVPFPVTERSMMPRFLDGDREFEFLQEQWHVSIFSVSFYTRFRFADGWMEFTECLTEWMKGNLNTDE
jgi:hypothetical protein